jgi:RimJ/RimL family protein N-acetyltransferase
MLIADLETPRLIIRDVRASDVDSFHRYMKQEQYWRDVPIDTPTVESITNMVTRCLADQQKDPRTDFFLAAVSKVTADVVGEAILHVRSVGWRQGEIGWGVGSDHSGQGLATEIGTAMLRLAFDRLSLHRVYAQCRTENLASRRIMAKLGMCQEGILRENVLARGSWWSSVQYSILSGERAIPSNSKLPSE